MQTIKKWFYVSMSFVIFYSLIFFGLFTAIEMPVVKVSVSTMERTFE